GLIWSAAVLLLMAADWLAGASGAKLEVAPNIPGAMGVGRAAPAGFALNFRRPPAFTELSLEGNARFAITPRRLTVVPGQPVQFELNPLRRGEGRLEQLWLRWTGPLGLIWIQRTQPLNRTVPILPDIQAVR